MDRIFRFRHLAVPAAIVLAGLLPAKARAAAPTVGLSPAQPAGGYVVCAGQSTPITLTATNTGGTVALGTTGTVPTFVSFNPTLPAGARPSPVTDTITVAPPAGTSGTFSFSVTATDGTSTTTTPITLVVDRAPSITLSQAGTTLTPPAGGFHFTACVGQPFILDMASSDADAADTASVGVLTSVNGGPATNVLPNGAFQSPNAFGTDTAGPGVTTGSSGSDFLGSSTGGATFTSRLTFTPTVAEAGSNYVIKYISTDGKCTTVVPVTVSVATPTATTITFTSTPDVSSGLLSPDVPVCYTATVLDQCGSPMAGVPVTFTLSGVPFYNVTANGAATNIGTVTNATVTSTTNGTGQAQVCFTPLFPGNVSVTGAAGAVTFPAPAANVVVISTPGAYVEGRGFVDSAPGTTPPIPGFFSMDIRQRISRAGAASFVGALDFTVPGTRGRVFRARSLTIDSIVVTNVPGQPGHHAVIFGTIARTGAPTVPFRADAVGLNNNGAGDSLVITLAEPGGIPPSVQGGPLLNLNRSRFDRGHEIIIRTGVPVGGGVGGLGGGAGAGGGGGAGAGGGHK